MPPTHFLMMLFLAEPDNFGSVAFVAHGGLGHPFRIRSFDCYHGSEDEVFQWSTPVWFRWRP